MVSNQEETKEFRFSVYLHPAVMLMLDDLCQSHGDRRAVVNAAIWMFFNATLQQRDPVVRVFALTDKLNVPAETPDAKLARMRRELTELEAACRKQSASPLSAKAKK